MSRALAPEKPAVQTADFSAMKTGGKSIEWPFIRSIPPSSYGIAAFGGEHWFLSCVAKSNAVFLGTHGYSFTASLRRFGQARIIICSEPCAASKNATGKSSPSYQLNETPTHNQTRRNRLLRRVFYCRAPRLSLLFL
jgi:hypothetical protein